MMEGRVGEKIGVREDVIQKACKLSMKAHDKAPVKPYVHEKIRGSNDVVFAFPGSWSVDDWYTPGKSCFGEIKVDVSRFPCMKSIGYEEIGVVNHAFTRRFDELITRSSLANEVLLLVYMLFNFYFIFIYFDSYFIHINKSILH